MPKTQDSRLVREFKLNAPRSLYFAIFAVSGFSGLIYESIWSHYLKLFLGHAAYAQSLVLIIFMGGMALGSWFVSRYSARSKSPILIYAGIELAVGIAALVFHDAFTHLLELFYSTILPSIGLPAGGAILKWLAASLLIMPQSILLGMTFPLMSAGIIRRFPDTPGGSISMLYFTNSVGAAIGVLASGFWMIELVGLPGTILSAGLLNIALGITVWVLVRLDPTPNTRPMASEDGAVAGSSLRTLFLIGAFITGAASFIYEIAWIRMLSLVLGATTHSFELMLSAFIFGLAFGGLWIKRRIDRIVSPMRFSGNVQVIMGILALLTIPVYLMSFDWMQWLLQALDSSDAGYLGFTVTSHAIAMALMLPTTFVAGMTLPLFTYALIHKGCGESSIGQVYAANTLGAIIGVIFAVHVGLPLLGLKSLIVFGAILDIGLGLVLLSKASQKEGRQIVPTKAAVVGLTATVVTVAFVHLDPMTLTSGVYRTGNTVASEAGEVVYYHDGKTASVSLLAHANGMVTLSTNGKPDASIQFHESRPYSADEVTMIIAGTLPLAYKPDAVSVANIGMGSGLTTHALLANSSIEKVDTVEIEASIVAAAAGYGKSVERAFSDPRSRIHIEDAKTFFSLNNNVYDIIIAEPSNPWVSGVASLFSTEFYRTIKRYLVDDGIFVQWIQSYEFSDDLAVSILKALSENFSDYAVYTTDSSNILLIAVNEGELTDPDWSAVFKDSMAQDLARIDVNSDTDFQARKIIGRDALVPFLNRSSIPVNSDYFPYVDLNAGRARFKSSQSRMFVAYMNSPLPIVEMLGDQALEFKELTNAPFLPRTAQREAARWIFGRLVDGASFKELTSSAPNVRVALKYSTEVLRTGALSCAVEDESDRFLLLVHDVMAATLPYLDTDEGLALIRRASETSCPPRAGRYTEAMFDLYAAVARRDGAAMAATSAEILAAEAGLPSILEQYVVTAAMLGNIADGRPDDAATTWIQHSEGAFQGRALPVHTKILSSIALGSAASEVNVSAASK